MPERTDIVIVGAGAAGLMTAIHAGRGLIGSGRRILLLDGASTIGVKILVAGGGRCNVTHHAVDELQYAGGSRNTIRKILRQFDVPETIAFFKDLGVDLKREDTGKLFPTTDSARTVLDALLREVRRVGAEIRNPWRVGAVQRSTDSFIIAREGSGDTIEAERLVLATGGMALPRSGSDGEGYALATGLGHTLTERRFPALVPLVAGEGSRWLTELSGISARAAVEVRAASGKRLARYENDLLLTHFGLSGPAVMDASRWLTHARFTDPGANLRVAWLPHDTFDAVDQALLALGPRRVLAWLREHLPERLALALLQQSAVPDPATGATLTKDARRALVHALTEMPVEIARDRGFTHAEATAGGVTLSEVDPATMQSRLCPGLTLVGEILDVDGRIGGFNFQWAWATGAVGGKGLLAAN
jgi:hypothetical protein